MKSYLSKFTKLFIVINLCILNKYHLQAQSIGKPTFQYSGICARGARFVGDPPFDSFLVDFNINSLNLFGAGNKFFLEISDSSGSFATPVVIVLPTTITATPASLQFIVPSNFVGGENFKFRVKSTNPQLTSPESNAIYAYYKTYIQSFKLNNGDATAVICDNIGTTLKVNSPAATFSNLVYKWFKNGVLIPNETGNTYFASTAGSYYAEIFYGSCTQGSPFSSKPAIIVNFSTSGQNITIATVNGNVVSQSAPVQITSSPSVTGFTYQWFRDSVLITGATNAEFTTNLPGTYYMVINNGTCEIKSNSVVLTQFVPPVTKISAVVPNLISPNNDSFNDTWELPLEYLEGTNTNIQILDSSGNIVFVTDNYINNWPQSTIDFESINPVFYYIITPKDGTILKGTITVVK